MPDWKTVPTLKTLSLRRIAWPDAVHKALDNKTSPTLESYVRNTSIQQYFKAKEAEIKTMRRHNVSFAKDSVQALTENVINTWIKLSNFYETRLNEIDSMSMFMRLSTIAKLDFLHEGFTLHNEKNFMQNIFPYIGVIPYTIKPQLIDYRTWLDIVNVMVTEGVCDTLEKLYIPFGNNRIVYETMPHSQGISSLTYRFEDTMTHFTSLKTIIVRGDIDDNFMMAVGENCFNLEYLDVRGTDVTDRGVALLLFRKLGKRFFKGTFLPFHNRFPCYPKEILQPCSATLKYLDISNVSSDYQFGPSYDLYVTRACPQLRPTPMKLYYSVPGETRVILGDFSEGEGLINFRQHLVYYIRQIHAERIFDFVQVLLSCIHFEDPSLEIMENDFGEEIAFLFKSGSAIVIHCELENLAVLTLISYGRNALNFIPISLISKFAPKLQKLKAPLKGTLTDSTGMKFLKYICSPIVKELATLESLVEHCPDLQYLEVRDIFTMDTAKQFGDSDIEKIFPRDPGEYKNLEVLRFLFPNKILLYPGLSWLIVRCPSLKIIGDLSVWGVPFDTLMRIYSNTSLYNYEFAVEYNGILHYCQKRNSVMDLARFE